eukprot:gnl/TRDRNA2_/TRDRNA2_180423_c0_seq1.p1 gnl/TRDRNA2_/TRDRNA2_180423_c0~~gnl/TRDRNA2_/TRDRNA2_180423_c0_seq1.p1  ORF type:complete len:191 (-),score=29.26 gnl/TRDRNA2_/TRDRNA2_180423_c0_seq1:62-634(-)
MMMLRFAMMLAVAAAELTSDETLQQLASVLDRQADDMKTLAGVVRTELASRSQNWALPTRQLPPDSLVQEAAALSKEATEARAATISLLTSGAREAASYPAPQALENNAGPITAPWSSGNDYSARNVAALTPMVGSLRGGIPAMPVTTETVDSPMLLSGGFSVAGSSGMRAPLTAQEQRLQSLLQRLSPS